MKELRKDFLLDSHVFCGFRYYLFVPEIHKAICGTRVLVELHASALNLGCNIQLSNLGILLLNLLLSCRHQLGERPTNLHVVQVRRPPRLPSVPPHSILSTPVSYKLSLCLNISQIRQLLLQSHTLVLISHLFYCIPTSFEISWGCFLAHPSKESLLKMII